MSVVLVGRHHHGVDTGLVGLTRQGAYHVVGLKAGCFYDRDIVSFEYLLYDRCAEAYSLGRFLALCLVRRIGFVAEGAAVRVESHANVCGLLLAEHFLERVEETEDSRDILAAAVDARILYEAVVGTVDKGVGIEEKELHCYWIRD